MKKILLLIITFAIFFSCRHQINEQILKFKELKDRYFHTSHREGMEFTDFEMTNDSTAFICIKERGIVKFDIWQYFYSALTDFPDISPKYNFIKKDSKNNLYICCTNPNNELPIKVYKDSTWHNITYTEGTTFFEITKNDYIYSILKYKKLKFRSSYAANFHIIKNNIFDRYK